MKNILILMLILAVYTDLIGQQGLSHYIEFEQNGVKFPPLAVDLDNDGYKDLLYGTGDIMYRKNLNGNSFGPLQVLYIRTDDTMRTINRTLSVGDFNNDGRKDIFARVSYRYPQVGMVVFLNQGNFNFSILDLPPASTDYYTYHSWNLYSFEDYNYAGNPDVVDVVADWNNDGFSDVLLSTDNNADHYVTLYYYNSGNTKVTRFELAASFGSHPVFTDVDGDGRRDLLCKADYPSNNAGMLYYKNQLDTSFSKTSVLLKDVQSVFFPENDELLIADWDLDGKEDILAHVKYNSSSGAPGYYAYKKNLGNGNYADFKKLVRFTRDEKFYKCLDADKDGDLDMLTFIGFNTITTYAPGGDSLLLYRNNNGILDTVGVEIQSLRNKIAYSRDIHVSFDHFDADNTADLIIHASDSLRYFKNSGSLSYKEKMQIGYERDAHYFAVSQEQDRMQVFDIDKDNDADVILVNQFTNAYVDEFRNPGTQKCFDIFINDGNGTFTKSRVELQDTLPDNAIIRKVDFNNDGWEDICIISRISTHFFVFLNDHGGFNSTYIARNSSFPFSYAPTCCNFHTNYGVKDLNGDGQPEIISCRGRDNGFGNYYIFLQTYNTITQQYSVKAVDTIPYNLKADFSADFLYADFNNDGLVDLLSPDLSYYINQGNLNFRKKPLADSIRQDVLLQQGAVVSWIAMDVNNDGWKDVVLEYDRDGINGTNLLVLQNKKSDSFYLQNCGLIPYQGDLNGFRSHFSDMRNVADIDNDGYDDIIMSFLDQDSYLYAYNDRQSGFRFDWYGWLQSTYKRIINPDFPALSEFAVAKINADSGWDVVSLNYIVGNEDFLKWRSLPAASTPYVDLLVSALSLNNDTLFVDDSITVTATLRNDGTLSSGYVYKIYLSRDTLVNAGDILLYTLGSGTLSAKNTFVYPRSMVLQPFGTGWVYCLVTVDTVFNERNTRNNYFYTRLFLKDHQPTAVEENSQAEWQVFPNPFGDKIQVNSVSRIVEARLVDVNGKLMNLKKIGEGIYSCKNCTMGSYFLFVEDSEGRTGVITLMKIE